MNLKELEKKYEELGKEIERLKGKQLIKNDPIFLLSAGEYKKHKDRIPHINCWWWLRTSSVLCSHATCVDYGGYVCYTGNSVIDFSGAVRPALRISNLEFNVRREIRYYENYIVFNGVTWTKIDDDLYIAEVPIAFRRFDEKSNDYESSEVRKFLLDWFEDRQRLNK